MANGHFEHAMEQADDRLAQAGYDRADLRDIMLVGFRYLTRKQEESRALHLRINGKGFVSVAILIGGVVGGLIQALL